MNIELFNDCNKEILVSVDGNPYFKVKPNKKICLSLDKNVTISVKGYEASRIEKGKFVLSIESKYYFDNLVENEEFFITGEKIRVGSEIYYENLFINSNKNVCICEEFSVPDAKKIYKLFQKKRWKQILLIRPLEYFTGLVFASVVLFFPILNQFGIVNTILCYVCAYAFMVCLALFVECFWNIVFKKFLKSKSDKEKFRCYLDETFIRDYYLDSRREPFNGERESL